MKVSACMSTSPATCLVSDSLHDAARIMWEKECGFVPVLDQGRLVGVITDRDVAMAAYIQGSPLGQIPVEVAMARVVYAVSPDDDLETAEARMRSVRVRRLPVVDPDRGLVGVLALTDLFRARAAESTEPAEAEVEYLEDDLAHLGRTYAQIATSRAQEARRDAPSAPAPASRPEDPPIVSYARQQALTLADLTARRPVAREFPRGNPNGRGRGDALLSW